jgi:hypothetical protein
LGEFVEEWKKYSLFVYANNKMFHYLDKFYTKNHSQLILSDQALDIFRDLVFKKKMTAIRRSIIELVQKDREDELVDKELIKRAVLQFVYMGFEQRTLLRKVDGSAEVIQWIGEKNLLLYDQQFEE